MMVTYIWQDGQDANYYAFGIEGELQPIYKCADLHIDQISDLFGRDAARQIQASVQGSILREVRLSLVIPEESDGD